MPKLNLRSQNGSTPILVLVAIIGVLGFIAITNIAPFKNSLLSSLFPKDSSHASVSGPISGPVSPSPAASGTPMPSASVSPIPAFKGEYFNNKKMSGIPVIVRDDQTINFDWGTGSPATGIGIDGFSVRWTKQDQFLAGTYTFTVGHDDGMRVFIDNKKVYERWSNRAVNTATFNTVLTAGQHQLKVEYYDNTSQAFARVQWVKQ